MRVVAATMLYLYIAVLSICSLGIQGTDYPSVSFKLKGATANTFRKFVKKQREMVALDTIYRVNNLPVLRREGEVPDEDRFVLVNLTNYNSVTVTFALDVTNVWVVGFSADGASTFFSDATSFEKANLFPNTTQQTLSFGRSYEDLEREAGPRKFIDLGLHPLDVAITSLWHGESEAQSLLVVIQMVSEAARFRYIEQLVRQSIKNIDHGTFRPNVLMLSMENSWSSMSLEVQRSRDGVSFFDLVQLVNFDGSIRNVDNFKEFFTITGVALLLFRCIQPSLSNENAQFIRMPIGLVGDDETCRVPESFTRRIIGRDGLCVYAYWGSDFDWTPVLQWICTQHWTFHNDGTIRSQGKCLAEYEYGNYINIFNCSTAVDGNAIKWAVSFDGSITNLLSQRVLSALSASPGVILKLNDNNYDAGQGWSVSNNVQPIVTMIVGYEEMCLQANGEENHIWLEDCMVNNSQLQWALYGDGTIRVQSDRSLCITSDGHNSKDLIITRKCQGWGNQRWVFNTDGTILNPNAQLVMDVRATNVSLRQIILYRHSGNPNQQWRTQMLPS